MSQSEHIIIITFMWPPEAEIMDLIASSYGKYLVRRDTELVAYLKIPVPENEAKAKAEHIKKYLKHCYPHHNDYVVYVE